MEKKKEKWFKVRHNEYFEKDLNYICNVGGFNKSEAVKVAARYLRIEMEKNPEKFRR